MEFCLNWSLFESIGPIGRSEFAGEPKRFLEVRTVWENVVFMAHIVNFILRMVV